MADSNPPSQAPGVLLADDAVRDTLSTLFSGADEDLSSTMEIRPMATTLSMENAELDDHNQGTDTFTGVTPPRCVQVCMRTLSKTVGATTDTRTEVSRSQTLPRNIVC